MKKKKEKMVTVTICMTEEEAAAYKELADIWGYRVFSAFCRMAIQALPGRMLLEHKEANGAITPLESRSLNIMKGGRK